MPLNWTVLVIALLASGCNQTSLQGEIDCRERAIATAKLRIDGATLRNDNIEPLINTFEDVAKRLDTMPTEGCSSDMIDSIRISARHARNVVEYARRLEVSGKSEGYNSPDIQRNQALLSIISAVNGWENRQKVALADLKKLKIEAEK